MNALVACGILARNGSILLGRRAENKADPIGGKWVTPGGHVEDDENFDEALEREFLEETGLVVQAAAGFLHVDKEKEWLGFRQVVCAEMSTLVTTKELPEIKWHTWPEIVYLHDKGLTTPETFAALKAFLK